MVPLWYPPYGLAAISSESRSINFGIAGFAEEKQHCIACYSRKISNYLKDHKNYDYAPTIENIIVIISYLV